MSKRVKLIMNNARSVSVHRVYPRSYEVAKMLTNNALDPKAKIPAFKVCAVRILLAVNGQEPKGSSVPVN